MVLVDGTMKMVVLYRRSGGRFAGKGSLDRALSIKLVARRCHVPMLLCAGRARDILVHRIIIRAPIRS